MQQAGELTLAEKALAPSFGSQQVQPQRRRPVRFMLVRINGGQITKDLAGLPIGDSAVGHEPVPRARLGQAKLFQPPRHRFSRNPESMGQEDDMPPGEAGRSRRDFAESLHDGACRRQEGPPERICIAFFARVLLFIGVQYLGLAPS